MMQHDITNYISPQLQEQQSLARVFPVEIGQTNKQISKYINSLSLSLSFSISLSLYIFSKLVWIM